MKHFSMTMKSSPQKNTLLQVAQAQTVSKPFLNEKLPLFYFEFQVKNQQLIERITRESANQLSQN